MRNRLGVRGRLLMAFFGISAFAVLAAGAAMYSFLEVGKALDRITQQRLPSVLSSLEISRKAERIVAVAPTLLTVSTPAQREQLSGKIAAEIEQLDALLSDLQDSTSDTAVLELIERDVAQLKTNFDALDVLVAKRLEAREHKSALLRRLSNTHNAAQRLITPGLMVVEGDLSQLQRVLVARNLSSEERIASVSGLMSSIAASPPLQRIQIEALNVNNVLRRVASAPRPAEVAILAFPLGRSLDLMRSLADRISPTMRRRLLARIEELRNFVDGPNSILEARRHELAILADSERLLGENAALSAELTEAVDLLVTGANRDIVQANLEALSVQRVSTAVLIAVVALSLISSTLIVWLYVGRNLIARLTAMSGSMLAIAGGRLDTSIPAAGSDEIGDMGKALAVFRDTAIEVKETNLREIREARRRLIDAIESISEGFALYDSEGGLALCNKNFRDIHKYRERDTEPGVATYDSLGRLDEAHGTLGRQPISFAQRVAKLRHDGITETIQFIGDRILERRQSATPEGGIISVTTDITERKQAEEELARKEAQLRVALDNMPGGMFMIDNEFRFQVFNDRVKEIFDLPDAVMRTGGSLRDVLRVRAERGDYGSGNVDELVERRLRGYTDKETLRVEERLPGGRVIELFRRPTDDGGTVGVVTDITERKQAEEALAEKEAQLRLALDNMPGGIVFIDRDRNFVLSNPQYSALHDYPDGLLKVGGSLHDELRFQAQRGDYGSDDPDKFIEDVVALFESGEPISYERTLPTGRTLHFSSAPTPEGGYVTIATDITERKQAEAALQEAHQIIKDQRDRMEDELNIGHEIQMSMIPLVFPPFPDHDEFSVFAALEPAREVGGDFYDYYFIDEERICFCIGDVSGKGVPAALFMAITKTLVKSRAIDDFSTASILTHVNAELSADIKTGMFVTIFLGILNFRSGEFVYTNAGHNPPYLRRKGGSLQRLDVRHGPVIGAVPGLVYREDTETMAPGDMLFLYTDGVTEERNADRELFSEKRLVSVLASKTVDSVEDAVRDTVAAVKDFRGDGSQEDDITALAVQFHGSSVHDPIAVFHIMARNDMSEVARVDQEFQKFAEEHGIPVEVGQRIRILFDDLLSNVISYAFSDDEAHEIEIRTELATNRLTVTISDDGIPFNPLEAGTPDTSLPLDKRTIGGLGIHLSRNLVDDMSYHRRSERNVLTLVKYIE